MMGKKKLSEIKAQLVAASAHPSGKHAKAGADPNRIVQTLESLCATLEGEIKKHRKPMARRRTAKR
jgi:hypothetical protein